MFTQEQRSWALQRLFRVYKVHSVSDFETIRAWFNIQIIEVDIPLFNAYLGFGKDGFLYKVEVSKSIALEELRQFLVYHEIAELCIIALHRDEGEEYWEKEYWCDAFASAMILANHGLRVIDESEYEQYFIEGLVNLKKREAPDRFEGERLKRFAASKKLKKISALGTLLSKNAHLIAT